MGALVALIDNGTISRNTAKAVFGEMVKGGEDPREIVERRGLGELVDASTLAPIVEQLLADNADKVAQYRAGRTGLLGFFVGQVMQASGGRADPKAVQEVVQRALTG
jgi:glutaminyl-tRNA synthetase